MELRTEKRYTTVELIVDEKPWQPPPFKPEDILHVEIAFDETDLRHKIKAAGGRWSKTTKTWKIPFKVIRAIGLEDRIIEKENDESI